MASASAEATQDSAQTPVPVGDEEDLQEPPPDPWAAYTAVQTLETPPPGFSPARSRGRPGPDDMDAFEESKRRRRATQRPPARRPRYEEEDGDDDGGGPGRSNAGPPPQWDGTTSFRDYEVRAKLWLATTKVKARARGPMLLKSLTGTPFDDLKYLAKDDEWMQSDENGARLLKLMNTKELYGEDEREEMINTLVKVTYTLRRSRGEAYKAFFARWDNAVRRLSEHKVELPQEYLGFLLVMALQVAPDEVKLMMNYTQGKLTQKAVKEWIRVQEADLAWSASQQKPRKAESIMMIDEASEFPEESLEPEPADEENVEVLLSALGELDENADGESVATTDVFDEDEAKEILATMVREHSKGGPRRSFKAVNDAKRAKGLARGYGAHRDPSGRFGTSKGFGSGKGSDHVRTGQSYKISIEALKKKTRCARCHQVGHWRKECPNPAKPKENYYVENESEEALFLHYLDFVDYQSSRSQVAQTAAKSTAASSSDILSRPTARPGPENGESAYMCSALGLPHELMYVNDSAQVDEDSCATIDTGCQRTAIGKETLDRMISRYPQGVQPCYKPEEHVFKSVNGLSRTQRVACLPASLGPGGCILRPAVFEDGQSSKAPFLISLPFLLFCRAQLDLDPQRGLRMKLRRFNHEIPLHIGPTGALRVPLDQFDGKMLKDLSSALDNLREPKLEANLLKAEEPDQEDPLHGGSVRPNLLAKNLSVPPGLCDPPRKHAVEQQAPEVLDRGGETISTTVPLASHGATYLHHHGQQRLPGGGKSSRPPTQQEEGTEQDGGNHPRHEPRRAAGSPRDDHERHDRGPVPGGGLVRGGAGSNSESLEAASRRVGHRDRDVDRRVREPEGPPVLLQHGSDPASDQEAGSQPASALLAVPPIRRCGEQMRVFPVGSRSSPRHVDEPKGRTSTTDGEEIYPTELSSTDPRFPELGVSGVYAEDTQRCQRIRHGGRSVRLQEPEAGGHGIELVGDPDSMHPVRKDGDTEAHEQGSGVLRQEEYGATYAEGVAANPSDFLGVYSEAISDARDTALQQPVWSEGGQTSLCELPRVSQQLQPGDQVQEIQQCGDSRRHDTRAGRDLCRVPGVQAVHGGKEGGGVNPEPPEVRLSVSGQRHMMASLKRAEQVWTDLQNCLINGRKHLRELKDRAASDYKKGFSKQKRKVYAEIFNLSQQNTLEQAPSVQQQVKLQQPIHDRILVIDLESAVLLSSTQHSILTYVRHARPGLVIIRQPEATWFRTGRPLDYFKQQQLQELKDYIHQQQDHRVLVRFSKKVIETCSAYGAVFVAEEPWKRGGWQEQEARHLKETVETWNAEVNGWRDGHDQERDGGRDEHDQGRDGGRDEHDQGRDGGSIGHQVHRTLDKGQRPATLVMNRASLAKRLDHKMVKTPEEGIKLIVQTYAKIRGKAAGQMTIVKAAQVLEEDRQHDGVYFTETELNAMTYQETVPTGFKEILHQEEDEDADEQVIPGNYGLTAEILQTEGVHPLEDGMVAVVKLQTDRLPVPTEEEEYSNFPWRSSWSRGAGGDWSCLEDEVRWQELHQPGRTLPQPLDVVVIYRKRLDGRRDKRMNHFPGMSKVTLERMVRRAHEGLGHPENGRFVRILRHSHADPEAIEIAKNLRCCVCEAYKVPAPIRQGAPPREDLFINDLVGVDTVHLRNHKNQAVPALNMIDWHSHFQLVVPMAAETAAETRKAYRQWVRFFGPPRKLMIDLGGEFKAEFRKQAEEDGSELVPGPLETPTQRGLTERAGGVFKDILYKAMATYGCNTFTEWKELVDVTCMTRNRLLLRGGYSPIQRVIGYSPRIPGGLLQGGEQDEMVAELQHVGDTDANKAMRMRKAAAMAFHEADCDQALRAATLAGRRQHQNIEVGQAIYFWRRGAGTHKKTRTSYWQGPGRVVMTSLPNAVWIAYQGSLVKAAPERTRPATEEEALSLSGWMRGLSQARGMFDGKLRRNFVDLTKDQDPVDQEQEDEAMPQAEANESWQPPLRRVRAKTSHYSREPPRPDAPAPDEGYGARMEDTVLGSHAEAPEPNVDEDGDLVLHPPPGLPVGTGEHKREMENPEEPSGKRSRVEMLEAYHMNLTTLAKQRQKKEARAQDFTGKDQERLERAILKEINNNLGTGAYKILSLKESQDILQCKPEKVMESRYVLTKKPLEPNDVAKAQAEDLLLDDRVHGPVKAKCRHVMKGFSEEAALDVESTTPQVSRDSVIFVAQVLASMGWDPGFLDFTQAFHSGDKINRELYCKQPKEGIPGMHKDQILMLLKTCYGLTDGPYAWYQHLCRRLREFGYRTSRSDPCVFFLHTQDPDTGNPWLEGIIGLATDDMLHGGGAQHWSNIQQIATEYKLGKNQKGSGRFTGKDIRKEADGSLQIDQAFYVKEKAEKIVIPRKRKQQRFSRRRPDEVEQLRSQLGVLSWLAKETRCDLAGRVCLLQQCFPEPKVADLIECNRIIEEAIQHAQLGIKVMPIPWQDLRVSVVTDAAWGNSKDQIWIETSEEDFWEETPTEWIRHHRMPRRTTFHPGAAQGGPDLHDIVPARVTEYYLDQAGTGIRPRVAEDDWTDDKGIRVLHEDSWLGRTRFRKSSSEEPGATKIHSSLQQLQNLSSQGGQIILYHDKGLAEGHQQAATTLAAWRSFRLKRKTVDTLAAEGQALQAGIGSIHWHRLMFLEAFYGMLSTERWREESRHIPFLAAVDSKSLYDAANKCTSTTAYISDKRTAIDLAVIKADLLETSGTIRWIDTRAMIADPLTKIHPAAYLRYVMDKGRWSIVEEGTALQRKAIERGERVHQAMHLMFWEHKV